MAPGVATQLFASFTLDDGVAIVGACQQEVRVQRRAAGIVAVTVARARGGAVPARHRPAAGQAGCRPRSSPRPATGSSASSDDPAGTGPTFRTVSSPRSRSGRAGGRRRVRCTVVAARSGRATVTIAPGDATQLFASLLSATTAWSSAHRRAGSSVERRGRRDGHVDARGVGGAGIQAWHRVGAGQQHVVRALRRIERQIVARRRGRRRRQPGVLHRVGDGERAPGVSSGADGLAPHRGLYQVRDGVDLRPSSSG